MTLMNELGKAKTKGIGGCYRWFKSGLGMMGVFRGSKKQLMLFEATPGEQSKRLDCLVNVREYYVIQLLALESPNGHSIAIWL